jgi:hypothetical protein
MGILRSDQDQVDGLNLSGEKSQTLETFVAWAGL